MPAAKPYSLRQVLQHPLARMLPLFRYQEQVYRMAEKHPPSGGLEGYGPDWECVSLTLSSRATLQVRVNLQRSFTLMAIQANASLITAAGGFRAQFYDTAKKRRFADRGVVRSNIAGASGGGGLPGPIFLREPYQFDVPDSQILVIAQNLETDTNNIQIVFYGLCLRFNEARPGVGVFPGGVISSAWGE